MFNSDTLALVQSLASKACRNNVVVATAESCTGGLIAAAFTEVSGSSVWFDRGFVTYSNEAKQEMLGVKAATLASHGAVSESVVRAMAEAAVARSGASLAVSVSGVAGPAGGSEEKPVGTVWIGCAGDGLRTTSTHHLFEGNRQSIRQQTLNQAVWRLIQCIDSGSK